MLALVYYDGVQNVVPFYDQRLVAPNKNAIWMVFCKNAKKHFEKAFSHRYWLVFSSSYQVFPVLLNSVIGFGSFYKFIFGFRQDWSHAFYLGKLCQKLGCPPEILFSYYDKAIVINPSAVDAVYRMHASRLKLLYTCQKTIVEALKVGSHLFYVENVIFCFSYKYYLARKDLFLPDVQKQVSQVHFVSCNIYIHIHIHIHNIYTCNQSTILLFLS